MSSSGHHGVGNDREWPSSSNNHYGNDEQGDDDEDDENNHGNNYDDGGARQQERIREEIKFDHLRDLETRRQQQTHNLDTSYTASDYEDFVNTSKNLGRSIQSLDDFGDDDYEDRENTSGGEVDDNFNNLSAAEKIQMELLEQNQRERELKEIHRSLSRENICNYDSECGEHSNDSEKEIQGDSEDDLDGSGTKNLRLVSALLELSMYLLILIFNDLMIKYIDCHLLVVDRICLQTI